MVPDVIVVATRAAIGERAPWIYADTAVDPDSLFAIIATWVRASTDDAALATVILRSLSPADLMWETLDIEFNHLTSIRGDNKLLADELYRLLPHVLAGDLAAPDVYHEHRLREDLGTGGESPGVVHTISRFRRCPAPEGGATVMNWPPHYPPGKPMSFLLRLTAQSRAFTSEPRVHLWVGTRRWAHKEARLSFQRKHTVYLLPSLPWLPGLVHSRSFLAAPLEPWKKPAPDTENGFEYSARWAGGKGAGGKLGRILRELGCTDRLPDPEDLTKDPAAWLGTADAAALVFREGMYPFDHPVSPGTSLADKVPLLTWVSETLSDHLELVEPLRKGRNTILAPRTLNAGKYSKSGQGALLRGAIARTVGPNLGIDIFWDTKHTRDHARRSLSALLGIKVPEQTDYDTGGPELVTTDELNLKITVRPVGVWGGPLEGNDDIDQPLERLQAAVTTRAERIIDDLTVTKIPTISLVEIKGKKSFTGKQRPADPKFAIKVGLSRSGRLSQCITEASPPGIPEAEKEQRRSDASIEKLTKSWHDLLRQLGVRTTPLSLHTSQSGITSAPAYLAVWLVRQNQQRWHGVARQVPVAVLIDPTGQDIKACAPGVAWLPLHQAQHEISRRHMLSYQKRQPADITRFCDNTLRSVARLHPSTLLLTCAQNLRWGWPYLQNSRLVVDSIQFGQQLQRIERYPGLRHVRVRTTEGDEVAECFAVNDDQEGHSAAYWPDNDRIFLSTGDKPVTASKAVKGASKVLPRRKDGGLIAPSPRAMVWNHRALELTVAAIQPGDHPEDWAALTHQLRWAAAHYDNALSWPWPLMVAKHLAEYLMPVQLLEEVLAGNDEQDKTDTNDRPSSPSAGLHARTAAKLTMNPDLTSQ
jgi:hypothetical protein